MMVENKFTILESYTRDVGRGTVRIDRNTMDDLSISSQDVVEIMGKQRTVAKCQPLYPADEGKKTIRMDGLVRNNCKAEIGSIVSIRKIKTAAAESVMVAPLEAIPPIDPRYLADALNDTPLIPKQFVMVSYFGGRLAFMVVGIMPGIANDVEAVTVTDKTRFGILDKKPDVLFSKRDVEDRRHSFLQKIWNLEKLSKSEFDCLVKNLTEFYDLLSENHKK